MKISWFFLNHAIHCLKRPEKIEIVQGPDARHYDNGEGEHQTGHQRTKQSG